MEKYSLLIGYQYTDTALVLPSTKADLMKMEQFCKDNKFSSILIITDGQSIFSAENFLARMDKGLIYITGHGSNDGFQESHTKIIKWTALQNFIFSSLPRHAEVLIILDCCNGSHLDLPYLLQEDQDRFLFSATGYYPIQQVVIIASRNHQAVSTDNGSLITDKLIELWQNKITDYFSIMKIINQELTKTTTLARLNLTLKIYASRPYLQKIWPDL